MSFAQRVNRFAKHPIETIQGVIALSLMFFGVYILMPFYSAGPGSVTQEASFGNSTLLRTTFCLVFLVAPTITTVLGFWIRKFQTPKWRAQGCFYMFVGICFIATLRLVSIGVNPPVWAFYLGLGVISGVLYMYWLVKD